MSVEEKVRGFLSQVVSTANIEPDMNLFSSGLINSLSAMELVLFVEKEFRIEITNEDLDFKNFSSMNAITTFIANKLSAAG
jgi:methoxymalonate biosynthesis acyl carrier protein